jgi:hypothetical protein
VPVEPNQPDRFDTYAYIKALGAGTLLFGDAHRVGPCGVARQRVAQAVRRFGEHALALGRGLISVQVSPPLAAITAR